jgi:SH3-like domain-containing protein
MNRVNIVRVTADYRPVYDDPIQLLAGDALSVGGEDEEFPGWRWCRGRDGREGWVPVELIDSSGATATITEHYSAAELAVHVGESLAVERSFHQWLLVSRPNGERGWIPASHVESVV